MVRVLQQTVAKKCSIHFAFINAMAVLALSLCCDCQCHGYFYMSPPLVDCCLLLSYIFSKQAPSLCYISSVIVLLWCHHHCLSCWHCCQWLIVVFKKILEKPSLDGLCELLQRCCYYATMVMPLPLYHVALLALAFGTVATG